MKNPLLITLALLGLMASARAYDFSAVAPSGQTLYYYIWFGNAVVTYPGFNGNEYEGFAMPTGNLVIPDSVTHNDTTYRVIAIGSSAFRNCSGLTSVDIPNTVTTIASSAFSYCSGLTSVDIPITLKAIGSSAFKNCSSLTSVNIPYSVNSIQEGAFDSCSSLAHVEYNARNCELIGYDGVGPFGIVPSITSMVIGDSVQTIPPYLMRGCIGLTSITIPNSVTTIGEGAFVWCDGLTSITIPNSVTTIGREAFVCCQGLTSITIPNSVTTIGNGAFTYCFSLTSATIGDSITTLPSELFRECTSLASVTLGSSVGTIRENAFKQCSNLDTFRIRATTPPIFFGTLEHHYYCTLYYPCGYDEAYAHWANFQRRYPDIGHSISLEQIGPGWVMLTNLDCQTHMATLLAIPGNADGFIGWSDGVTDNPRLATIASDTSFTAHFSLHSRPYICLVTVENGHCKLHTEEYMNNLYLDLNGINQIRVYCEREVANQFDLVGTADIHPTYDFFGLADPFIDTLSDPKLRAYRYCITAVDSAGNESAPSPVHRTSHLTINRGVSGWNLIWTPYQGPNVNVVSCRVWRGLTALDMEHIATIPGDLTSYTDPMPDADQPYYYQVELVTANGCPEAKTANILRTNKANTHGLGVDQVEDAPTFRLYPNPAGECVTVETRCTASQPQEVQIVDLQGRVVLREEITTAHSTLNTSHLTAGTYFVRLGTATQRLVVK